MSATELYLSVIIPSYNSSVALSRNLPYLLDFLKTTEHSYEVIIVDDGSNDGGKTEEIALQFHCHYLKNPSNMGKGAAVRNGMLHAKGTYRIFTDADVPYDNEAIAKMIRYLDFKEFDVVVGDRTLPESVYFSDISNSRNFGSKLFSFIVGRLITGGWFDTQCGIKGFRANVAEDIFSKSRINGFTLDVEAIYIALKRNYDIKRIPVKLRSQDGNSVSLLRHSLYMLADLGRIIFNFYSGKYDKKLS